MVFTKDKALINVFDRNRAIERGSLSQFPNRKWCVSFWNKLLNNIDNAVNEAAVLYFQWCILNVNKVDIVVYFSTVVCQLLLICFQVHLSKISAKSDKFLFNYN